MEELLVSINGKQCNGLDGRGGIYTKKAGQVIEQIHKTPFQAGCFDVMNIEVRYNVSTGGGFMGPVHFKEHLTIDTDIRGPGCCRLHCGPNRCAHALENGKCVDKYMRATVGRVLYPHHYGKEK